MTSFFLFALILGGGLLLVSLLGDFLEGDVDADADVSVDAGEGGGDVSGAFRIFTVRNVTYFLFGFGALGSLLTWLEVGLGPWATALLAVVAGGLAAAASALAFGWLQKTDSGQRAAESSFVGCPGRVTLPVGHGRVGQVLVRRGVREFEVRALPFDAAASEPERWQTVVVVDMRGGTALVSPMDELAPAGSDPAASS